MKDIASQINWFAPFAVTVTYINTGQNAKAKCDVSVNGNVDFS